MFSRDTYGVLARPLSSYGNRALVNETSDLVWKFYQDDNVSWQSPNKKDGIRINGEEKIFRFMHMFIREACGLSKETYSIISIGHSKFYVL